MARTFTGREVATAVREAVEAVDALGPTASVVEMTAGENMVVALVVDLDYWDLAGNLRRYVWNGEALVDDGPR